MKNPFSIRLGADGKAVKAGLDADRIKLAGRIRAATEAAGREALLNPLRAATSAGLRSRKLPTTWRIVIYPVDASVPTLNPAALIYSKAPKIIQAFSTGATIRPAGGRRYLWIPTENVPVGVGGKRDSPKRIERAFGKFHLARGSNDSIVALCETRTQGTGNTSRSRRSSVRQKGLARATPEDRAAGNTTLTPMFVLVKQVTLKKRLDIAGIMAAAPSRFAALLQTALGS